MTATRRHTCRSLKASSGAASATVSSPASTFVTNHPRRCSVLLMQIVYSIRGD